MEAFLLQSMPQEVSVVMENAKAEGDRMMIIAGKAERVIAESSDDHGVVGQSGEKTIANRSSDTGTVNQSNDNAIMNQSNDNVTVNPSNDNATTNPPKDHKPVEQTKNKPTPTPLTPSTHSSNGWQVVNSVAQRLTARSIAIVEETLPKDMPLPPVASLWENSLFVTLLLHLDDVSAATSLHRRSLQNSSSFCY